MTLRSVKPGEKPPVKDTLKWEQFGQLIGSCLLNGVILWACWQYVIRSIFNVPALNALQTSLFYLAYCALIAKKTPNYNITIANEGTE